MALNLTIVETFNSTVCGVSGSSVSLQSITHDNGTSSCQAFMPAYVTYATCAPPAQLLATLGRAGLVNKTQTYTCLPVNQTALVSTVATKFSTRPYVHFTSFLDNTCATWSPPGYNFAVIVDGTCQPLDATRSISVSQNNDQTFSALVYLTSPTCGSTAVSVMVDPMIANGVPACSFIPVFQQYARIYTNGYNATIAQQYKDAAAKASSTSTSTPAPTSTKVASAVAPGWNLMAAFSFMMASIMLI